MTAIVELPLWLFVLILAFAGVTFASHFLFPSVRWFLRRRLERAVEELNKRLERPIQPFKLMRRQDMILRLAYDPEVMQAVADYAADRGIRQDVAAQSARRYAREIVPGFSAATYFGFAIRAARWLSRALYRVRLGSYDEAAIRAVDPRATVVFVMNHRSNMDYVLVTYLVAERSALSYAVGEWARVWPLQSLIRAMGAYFIRRKYLNPLYRKVLARYVQMATAEGVTQAIFPEGGLSLDGRVGPAKKGLLHYIVQGFDPDKRDVVFIPVALNYDRVIEDRVLLEAAQAGERRFRARLGTIFLFVLRLGWQTVRGRFHRFGDAAVSFGAPLSLRGFLQEFNHDTEDLAQTLMNRVRAVMPVLPVPLVAAVLKEAGGTMTRPALEARVADLVAQFSAAGVRVHLADADGTIAPGSLPATVAHGLEALTIRGIVIEDGATLRVAADEDATLAFYADSIAHFLDAVAAPQRVDATQNYN